MLPLLLILLTQINNLTINGPESVTLPALAKFSVDNLPANSSVIYLVFAPSGAMIPDSQIITYNSVTNLSNTTSSYHVAFSGNPGTYTVVAIVSNAGILSKQTSSVLLTNSTPPVVPPPINPPPVVPPPINPPVPVNTAWMIGVFPDKSSLLFSSSTITPALKALNIDWASYSITDSVNTSTTPTVITNTKWGSEALKIGLPALLFVDANGVTISGIPMPNSESGILSLIGK